MKKLVIIKIFMAVIFTVMCISCTNTNTTEATITRVYQPIRSGMVHTYLEVQFEDGTKSSVILPDDDAVWNKARNKKGKKVKVKKSKNEWTFAGFIE